MEVKAQLHGCVRELSRVLMLRSHHARLPQRPTV